MPLPLFMGIILGFGFMGGAFGYAVARDKCRAEHPPPPPACNIRSDWDGNEPVHYGFQLQRDGEKIGRFDSVDSAIHAAERLGCPVEP